MTDMFDNTDNTDNTDIIIATCPECNEPIYDGEYLRMCQVTDCHVICHEHDAPICASCCEFTCPAHLATINGEDYCPACRAVVDEHMFDDVVELAAQRFKEQLGL